ncbi:MAG: ABC transporter ATP-binding protein, partial [Proteobacteria bacterium]|nr:ABC transporter ATP-binding protein [Pseudomonadota bacterium]NDG26698.1 ABC transporter ATP-binding protein [Pseudomonadota bacterium]
MKESKTLSVFKKLWPLIREYRLRLYLGVALIVLTTSLDLVAPIVIGKVADAVVEKNPSLEVVGHFCWLFLAIICSKALCESLQAYTLQTTGLLITQKLRVLVFEQISRFYMSYFDEHSSGRLLTRVINDVRSLSELFTASMSVLALDAMVIVGTVITMLVLDWRLGGLVLFTFPAVVWVIIYFGKLLSEAYREVRAKLSEINSFMGENIGAMATIHRLAAEKSRQKSFERIVDQHQASLMKSIHAYAQVQPWANVLNGIAMGTLLSVGGLWVIQGKIKVGILVAFLGYIRNLFQPIRDLVEKYNVVLSAMVSAERVTRVFDESVESDSAELIREFQIPNHLGIRFEHVGFQYSTRNEKAIHDISFEVDPGKSLAVVGATGSGKSTLVRLLLKFYECQEGTIFFGDRPLSEWPLKVLRKHVGFVPQEVYLFEGTVRDNLTIGNTFGDELLVEQCKKAQVWEFISRRGGLELKIQEGGTNLSLGERQLLSFARILVLNPEMLVMDEATASLDNAIEGRLMKAVKELLKSRTSIIIAHRLST